MTWIFFLLQLYLMTEHPKILWSLEKRQGILILLLIVSVRLSSPEIIQLVFFLLIEQVADEFVKRREETEWLVGTLSLFLGIQNETGPYVLTADILLNCCICCYENFAGSLREILIHMYRILGSHMCGEASQNCSWLPMFFSK